MKTPIALFTSLLVLAQSVANCADEDAFQLWRNLSARSQNIHHELMRLGPDTAPDWSTHEAAIEAIEAALNDLVDAGQLESKRIRLKPPADVNNEAYQDLFRSIEEIGEDFGFFVASEMCGLGARMRFFTIKPGDSFELHLRLPHKELRAFISRAKALGLLEEDNAEQGSAGQPATRPESDSEGGDKPQPESEGRSQ